MSGCLGSVIAALVDGELDHAAREKAQRHLAHCDVCRAEVEAQRRLKASLARLDPAVPSDALLARLADIASMPPVEPLRVSAPLVSRTPLRAGATPTPTTSTPTTSTPTTSTPTTSAPMSPTPVPSTPTRSPGDAAPSRVAALAARAAAPAPHAAHTPRAARAAAAAHAGIALAALPGSRTPPVPATSTRPTSRALARGASRRARSVVPRHRATAAGSAFAVLGVAAALALAAPPQRPPSTPVGPVPGAFVQDASAPGPARSGDGAVGSGVRTGGTMGAGLTSVTTVRPDGGGVAARPAVPVRAVVQTAGGRASR